MRFVLLMGDVRELAVSDYVRLWAVGERRP